MIIKTYGLHWKPNLIFGNKGLRGRNCFKGRVKHKNKYAEIDFWKTRGIYSLFKDFEVVYVGTVTDMSLGDRIANHYKYKGEYWNTFSFFSFSKINFASHTMSTVTDSLQVNKAMVIKTLEAILINTAEPFLNKQETRFPGAVKAYQIDFTDDKTMADIYNKLESLEKRLIPKKRKNY